MGICKEYLKCDSEFLLSCTRKSTWSEYTLILNNDYFIDDLQEQEKNTKQVQERLMTEFVKKLLHLVWKTLTQLGGLVTDLHAKRGGVQRKRQFHGREDVLCRAENIALQSGGTSAGGTDAELERLPVLQHVQSFAGNYGQHMSTLKNSWIQNDGI